MQTAIQQPDQCARILVADDDPDDRMMIEDALEDCGIRINLDFCVDGQDLVDHLQGVKNNAGSGSAPDLILLDINMPRMNGLEALRSIKEDPALKTIPVIMLTTSREEADVITSYRLGCNSFITKPNLYDSLVDLLKVLSEYWIDFVKHAPVQKAIDDTLGRD